MVASAHFGGATHALKAISFRDSSNMQQPVAVGQARNATALKLFFGSLSVDLSSDTTGGRVNSGLSVAIQTQSVTATPNGGAAPYAHSWAKTSGTGTWSITSPTSDTTTFWGGNCGPDESLTATFVDTVTDSAGNTVASATVTATVSNIGFNISGGGGPLP